MRLTSMLLIFTHKMPYRFRGKFRKVKDPSFKDLIIMKKDFDREERNMLILRHPYLTVEQSFGHMSERKSEKVSQSLKGCMLRNEKFSKEITIADRLNHLRVSEAWD